MICGCQVNRIFPIVTTFFFIEKLQKFDSQLDNFKKRVELKQLS
jgi:hypothetical protein